MTHPLLPWRAAIVGAAVLLNLPQAFAAPTEQELMHDNPAGNYLAARHAGSERDSAAAAQSSVAAKLRGGLRHRVSLRSAKLSSASLAMCGRT